MSIAFYLDEHVHAVITKSLRRPGVDVLTVQEDGRGGEDDPILPDRAEELGRVMVARDKDFLVEAARRQTSGTSFTGTIYTPKTHLPSDDTSVTSN